MATPMHYLALNSVLMIVNPGFTRGNKEVTPFTQVLLQLRETRISLSIDNQGLTGCQKTSE